MASAASKFTECDVIVIGAGHAGCEAALAAARSGSTVLCITPNLDRVGFMPCNPSIGGPGKSHIVAEIDALGGAMAEVADLTAVQTRRLNTSKGPAVQAIRHQVDKSLYAMAMKSRLEQRPGLALLQDEAVSINQIPGGEFVVRLRTGGDVRCRSVVVTAGTFLHAAMISGTERLRGGRAGDKADDHLTGSLESFGIRTRRFKTGTPPRIDGRTVDFSRLETQPGDASPSWFSRSGRTGQISGWALPAAPVHVPFQSRTWRTQLACHRAETNECTHAIIRANLDRAPMFNGSISGAGPRYCPSIEDKVARYEHKDAHPVFLEPEGWQSNELYVQGMSTSLPADVQIDALRTIRGMEAVEITRFGYAVEYDAVDPNDLTTTLESRSVPGVFLAGQVNGTSGYEEAAGQGLLAGLNASLHAQGREAVVLPRSSGYIGVMIDDLVNLSFDEPYRMLTARAEYRLLLRADTAEQRLTQSAHAWGLVDDDRFAAVSSELAASAKATELFRQINVNPNSDGDRVLIEAGESPVGKPMSLAEIMRRPGLSLDRMRSLLPEQIEPLVADIPDYRLAEFESDLKYAAFIEREQRELNRLRHMEDQMLPETADQPVPGLRNEARQQIERHRPRTYGDARRLAGVTAADLAALMIHQSRSDHAAP